MGDYPDYTTLMQIIGSDIMVPIDVQGAYIQMPIDVQGAYIMMPVDIQAQYITLDIDIVAQTVGSIAIDIAAQTVGDISVNLAASDITLNVDITAQTIGNLTISIEAQNVGVYLQPEWAALQREDKTLVAYSLSRGFGEAATVSYTPSGKDFYINSISFIIFAQGSGDYDHFLVAAVTVAVEDGGGLYLGGIGGGGIALPRPLVVPDGKEIGGFIVCQANVNCSVYLSITGYEV